MPVSTGCGALDELCGGGLPERRSVLVRGEPSTGKSTLGMQFLQAGLGEGASCLYLSTEQTLDELADSFAEFDFDLEHDGLTVATIHATPGAPLGREEDSPVIRTLDGSELPADAWFDLPFTDEYVRDHLSTFAPCDRIVLDSVSGLRLMADDEMAFRRSVYDLIRLFTDEFGATSMLVAESSLRDAGGPGDALDHAPHGVIHLWSEEVAGSPNRFLRVRKLRGVDHDLRRHRVTIESCGLRVVPGQRARDPPLEYDHLPTGVEGLDDLLGGGFTRGGLALVEHDGATGYYRLVTQAMARAAEAGMVVGFIPPAEVTLDRLDEYWAAEPFTVDDLLDDGRLITLDTHDREDRDHESILRYEDYDDWAGMARDGYELRGDRPAFLAVDTEPVSQIASPDEIRRVRYRSATRVNWDGDVVLYLTNPDVGRSDLGEFLVDSSRQVLRLWQAPDGLEFLKVRKTPTGDPGVTRVVSYPTDPPYLRLD